MSKSLTATLMGVLVEQGEYELMQPAPIPEWQGEGDQRQPGLLPVGHFQTPVGERQAAKAGEDLLHGFSLALQKL